MTTEWALSKIRKNRGSLGFGRGGDSQINISVHVATVTDGGVRVQTETGEVLVYSSAMVFVKDGDEVVVVEGGNPHSLSARDAKKLLTERAGKDLENTLERVRSSKKNKIRSI